MTTKPKKRPRRTREAVVVINDQTRPEEVRAAARSLTAHFLDAEFRHHGTYADLDRDYYEEP